MIRKYGKTAKANKYHNKHTVVDDMAFDSKREAAVYTELKLLRFAGEIENIKCQVPYPMVLNGIKICDYYADFVVRYKGADKDTVIDAKGVRTQVYRLKKKMMKAFYNIDIVER